MKRTRIATRRFEVVPLTEVPRKSTSFRDEPVQVQVEESIVAKPRCEEKVCLAREYAAATSRFSEAVSQLHRNMGITPMTEYQRLARASDQARMDSEQARLALEQHLATHGC